MGLWDVVRENTGVVKAIGRISTKSLSGLVMYRIAMSLVSIVNTKSYIFTIILI